MTNFRQSNLTSSPHDLSFSTVSPAYSSNPPSSAEVAQLAKELGEKDARIAELEEELRKLKRDTN